VKLQQGVNGYACHGKEINKKHQVAEIDESLVLKSFEKRMKTVHRE
jgi:hypothetical protein